MNEPLVRVKLHVWWHLLLKLDNNAVNHVNTVVIPFLEFCYGGPQGQMCSSKSPAKTKMPSSPIKKFNSLSSICLDAFVLILDCPMQASHAFEPLKLGKPLITAYDFSVHRTNICHSIAEAFNHLEQANHVELAKFQAVYSFFSEMIPTLLSSGKVDDKETISAFVTLSVDLMQKALLHSSLHGVVLHMLSEMKKMPPLILNSKSTWREKREPIYAVLQIMLDPNFVVNSSSPKLKKMFSVTLQALLKRGGSLVKHSLDLIENALTKLEECVVVLARKKQEVDFLPLWRIISSVLRDLIERHQEINQVDSTVECKYDACTKALIFPLKHIHHEVGHNIWKQYIELFKLVSTAALVIVSYESLKLESEICDMMNKELGQRPALGMAVTYAKVLHSCILSDLSLTSRGEPASLKSEQSFYQIVISFMCTLVQIVQDHQDEKECAALGIAVCSSASALISAASSKDLVALLLRTFVAPLAPLFNLSGRMGRAYEKAMEKMFANILTLINSKYEGEFTKELVRNLEPFLKAVLTHNKSSLKTKAQHMWQLTFSLSLSPEDVPPSIAAILQRYLVLSSESSQNTFPPETENVNSVISFGSFLNKENVQSSPATKDKSPHSKEPAEAPAFKKVFAKPFRSAAAKVNLEDESSQDFVPITSSSQKKRLLTEHQKDKLSSRRDDIPALYSELSRDDSQAQMPSRFFSQQSVDESQAFCSNTTERSDESVHVLPLSEAGGTVVTDKNPEAEGGSDTVVSQQCLADSDSPSVCEEESGSSKKRKGRTPIKNLAPVSVRNKVSKKKFRSAKVARTIPEDVKPSESPGESDSVSRVRIPRLTPHQDSMAKRSPVRVVSENPLVLETARADWEAATDISAVTRSLHFDGDDIIDSSQDPIPPRRGRKRKTPEEQEEVPGPSILSGATLNDATPVVQARKRGRPPKPKGKICLTNKENMETLTEKNKYGETPLHSAVKRGDLTAARELIALGADVNARDSAEWTPLHNAIRETPNAEAIIKLLLKNGADVNAQTRKGHTPLHDAAAFMPKHLVYLLLENGADFNIRNNQGVTPIEMAATNAKDLLLRKQREALEKTQITETQDLILTESDSERDTEGSTNDSEVEHVEKTSDVQTSKCNEEGTEEDDAFGEPPDTPKKVRIQSEALESMDEGASTAEEEELADEDASAPVKDGSAKEKELDSGAVSQNKFNAPLPNFSRIMEKAVSRNNSLPFTGRGARLLEMAKAKSGSSGGTELQQPSSTSSSDTEVASKLPLMSPKVASVLTTPKHRQRPWEKFQPSPSDASPPNGILKKALSENDRMTPPPAKRCKVQFMDPPVSDKVEIPRVSWSGRTKMLRLRSSVKLGRPIPVVKSLSSALEESGQSLPPPPTSPPPPPPPPRQQEQQQDEKQQRQEASSSQENSECHVIGDQPVVQSGAEIVYPPLAQCEEPVTSVLGALANVIWQKVTEKSLVELGVNTIGDLSSLTRLQAEGLKGLKPPSNVVTIVEALKKFEKRQEEMQATATSSKVTFVAPVLEVRTPEEEDQMMKELYERPSPSPTERSEQVEEVNPGNDQSKNVLVTVADEFACEVEDRNAKSSNDANREMLAKLLANGKAKFDIGVQVGEKVETKEVQVETASVAVAQTQTDPRTKEDITAEFMSIVNSLDKKTLAEVMKKCMDSFTATYSS